ncbi:protein of unknown function [Candidatus Methylomirabilis oxygeniifera]|uniref:Uncharacterized protein n=1 Tax=Methylomirabilis oxygeniifera TaxID=671143 RepID=D5MGW8_METO1|nr:protein of unknown function [Candidatus Methylomirabilis oxyfera]
MGVSSITSGSGERESVEAQHPESADAAIERSQSKAQQM